MLALQGTDEERARQQNFLQMTQIGRVTLYLIKERSWASSSSPSGSSSVENHIIGENQPVMTLPRLIGINHVAIEVGSIEDALAFYGQFFDLRLRGVAPGMAFIDMGDQFLALSE